MDDLTQIRGELRALGRQAWFALASETGVPFSTIKHFAYEQTAQPRYQTVVLLRDALLRRRQEAA